MQNFGFQIGEDTVRQLNAFLSDPGNGAVSDLRRVVAKFGTV